MQYLLMIYATESTGPARTESEIAAIWKEYGDFAQGITKSDNFRAANALQPTSAATTVRMKDGKTVTTDGPFAETREQLGGYYLVEAKDLDEAIKIASRIPALRYGGSVEVRPIWSGPKA